MKGAEFFPYGIVCPATIPDVADHILDEFFAITGELGIRSCIAFGLCLGLYRDGAYIEGDNDLDVIVTIPPQDTRLEEALRQHGFEMGAAHPAPAFNTHFHKERILLDVFWRPIGEFITVADFDTVTYRGKQYPAPHPVEEYLARCYTNWMVKSDEMTRYYG